MSERKKAQRRKFRDDCLSRDNFSCLLCPDYNKTPRQQLEVHHITNRNQLPNGGYVKENGITLCPRHHKVIEDGGPLYSPSWLYDMIGSSYNRALDESNRL